MVRSRFMIGVVLLSCLTGALFAQSPIRYIYDEAGRLVGVINANGDAAAYHYDIVGNLLSITRSTASQVAIIEFTPDTGPIGQTVTIYGTGFSATAAQNAVTFNGSSASITAATTTSLTVTVPSGATTGAISVTSPNGSASSAANYVVASASAPTITSFSPAMAAAGTAVTLTGTNFATVASENRLALNLAQAQAGSATSTSIGTTIPAATGSGRFRVTTMYGSVLSADDLFVPPSPYGPSDVVTTLRLAFATATNVTVGTASKVALVVFDGTANQRISLKLVPGPLAGITLYRPNLTSLATHSSGVGTTLMEPPVLPTTGTYQFLFDPTGTATGTTAFTLYDVPADFADTITAGGSAVTVTTTVPGQNGRLTFSGTTSDRISVVISSGPSGTVAVRKPDDTTLVSGNIGVLSSFIDTTALPSTGTYSLYADYTGAGTGSVTLTLYSVPADYSGTIATNGTAASVSLSTPGQNGSLTFSGTATHRYSLSVSSGPSGTVSLRRPDGTSQASVTSGVVSTFMEPQTLATTDTYSLKVDPTNAATGTLTLALYDVPADPATSTTIGASAITVSPSTPGQNATVTFSGTQNQQVTVRLTNNTIGIGGSRGSTTVKLLKPDGTQLTSTASNSLNFNLSTQTLPSTGTYTIVVDPSGANAGSIDVRVTNP